MSRVSDVNDIAAYVPMKWENGSACDLYFQPICIATSNLTINDLPIVFD